MAAALTTLTLRLTPAAKCRIVAATRHAGESVSKFITTAAVARAMATPDDPSKRLDRLERRATALLEDVQDEMDYRLAAARWQHHHKPKTRLLTGEQCWRALGLTN